MDRAPKPYRLPGVGNAQLKSFRVNALPIERTVSAQRDAVGQDKKLLQARPRWLKP